MNKEFLQVNGKEFYFQGSSVRLRGFGIGSWLNLEHFMLGVPTPDQMIRQAFSDIYGKENAQSFFNSFINNFIGDEDFQLLKKSGINFLRVPFNYRLLIDDQNSMTYREEGFKILDRLMDLCDKYEIFLMPDLHTTPGGQNPDWHSDNTTGIAQFWHFDVFRRQITALWQEIARRYKNRTYLMGYDLLNEPFMLPDTEIMNEFFQNTIDAIREVDQNHVIIVESDHFAMDFSKLRHFKDEQLALSFHYYPTVWIPNLLNKNYGREDRKAEFRKGLESLVEIRDTFSRPVICGEAGYDLHPEDMAFCMELLKDTLDLFEEYKISWAVWTYKDACFMGLVYPGKDSPWMEMVNHIHRKWTHYKEMDQADYIMDIVGDHLFDGIDDSMKYTLQFRLRGILYTLQSEKILKPLLRSMSWEEMQKLPDSFLLKNCSFWQEYFDLIKDITKG
ncbi:MAG: glycoside hydrolase family 5 [Eubacterium sp.]|nr:glycoside hydrolase family 5 [Eubacterium sp.]